MSRLNPTLGTGCAHQPSIAHSSIYRKASRRSIGSAEAGDEAHAVVASAARNGSVVAQTVHGHPGIAWTVTSVPQPGDLLISWKRPLQRPLRPCSRAGIVDGDGSLKPCVPLVHDIVGHVAR